MVHNSTAASKLSQAKMDAFKAWMWWCLHDGQARIPFGYAPLPAPVVAIGETALKAIK
jgi:hypothetical protein